MPNVEDDDVGDEYANCKRWRSSGESFCAWKSDKCIPDHSTAPNHSGHAAGRDDCASSES